MRLHELGKAHVITVSRAGAQEREVRHGEEVVCAGVVSGRPPVEAQDDTTWFRKLLLVLSIWSRYFGTCDKHCATKYSMYSGLFCRVGSVESIKSSQKRRQIGAISGKVAIRNKLPRVLVRVVHLKKKWRKNERVIRPPNSSRQNYSKR